MTTVYRVSKTVRRTDVYLVDNKDSCDSNGTVMTSSSFSIWPSRHDRRPSSTSPVVAMIEPFHREYSPGENDIKTQVTRSGMKESNDNMASALDERLFSGCKSEINMDGYGRSVSDKGHASKGVVLQSGTSSQSLHLDTATTQTSLEQTSPGSVCSTDSGIGSTQSIAEMWSDEQTTQQPEINQPNCPEVSSSLEENHNDVPRITGSCPTSTDTSALRLKRFIKRNLRINSEDSNSSDDSSEHAPESVAYKKRPVRTPEPQPQYRVDVTSQDLIWHKDSAEGYLLSPSLKTLDISNDSRLWNVGDAELPSDTESESSQDTVILMTSHEQSQNEDDLPISEDTFQQIVFINDHHLSSDLLGNLRSVELADFNEEDPIPETDFCPKRTEGNRDRPNNSILRHNQETHIYPTNIASTEINSSPKVKVKRVTFNDTILFNNSETARIIPDGQSNREDAGNQSATVNRPDSSLKTNFGYLSHTRIPSFRKMNQTFRRPIIKNKQDKPSALEQQLRDLSITESDETSIDDNDLKSNKEDAIRTKPVHPQSKKRVHFSEIVLKRIVCPPDNDITVYHDDTSVTLDERDWYNSDEPFTKENDSFEYIKPDNSNTTNHDNFETDQERNNELHNAVSYTASLSATDGLSVTNTENNRARSSNEKPVVKYILSRTSSKDGTYAQNANHYSRQSFPPEDSQNGDTKMIPGCHDIYSYPAKIENTPRTATGRESNLTDPGDQYDNKKWQMKKGAISKIPFFKDNMILYSTRNQGRLGHPMDTNIMATNSHATKNELCYDELSCFVDRDRDRIDKLRRRYRPVENEKQSFHSSEETADRLNLDDMPRSADVSFCREANQRDLPVSKSKHHNDFDTNSVEYSTNKNSCTVQYMANNVNSQVVKNSGDHTKTVYGTTADLFRMMDKERLRGSRTSKLNTGSKVVRRHSAHVHGTYGYPNKLARNSRNERNSMFE